MSSGSWESGATEPGKRVLDAPAARFRRRGTCHSSPVSAIYCYSTALSLTSIDTRKQEMFCPANLGANVIGQFLLRLVNSIINALASPFGAEYEQQS